MFYGRMEGRVILLHSQAAPPPAGHSGQQNSRQGAAGLTVGNTGNLVLIDETVYSSTSVQQATGGNIIVKIVSDGAEDDARLSALKGHHPGYRGEVAYACRNDGMLVTVKEVAHELTGGIQTWTVTLQPEQLSYGGGFASEVGYSEGGETYSPDRIAELRARRLLLNDPPPATARGYTPGSGMLEVMIQGPGSTYKATQCILRALPPQLRQDPKKFLETARLAAVFHLKATHVFEHVLELTLGPIADGKVRVVCRGQRRRVYSNRPATLLAIEGNCPLGD